MHVAYKNTCLLVVVLVASLLVCLVDERLVACLAGTLFGYKCLFGVLMRTTFIGRLAMCGYIWLWSNLPCLPASWLVVCVFDERCMRRDDK